MADVWQTFHLLDMLLCISQFSSNCNFYHVYAIVPHSSHEQTICGMFQVCAIFCNHANREQLVRTLTGLKWLDSHIEHPPFLALRLCMFRATLLPSNCTSMASYRVTVTLYCKQRNMQIENVSLWFYAATLLWVQAVPCTINYGCQFVLCTFW